MTAWPRTGLPLPESSPDRHGELLACVRCSACRETCPTYITEGREAATPRGRIALMLAEHEGRIAPNAALRAEIDLCLGCRACEAACPVGVPYGRLLEETRARLADRLPRPWWQRWLRRLALDGLIVHPRRLSAVAALARLYQRTRLARLLGPLLPAPISRLHALLPPLSRPRPLPAGAAEGRPAAFFSGCVAAAFLPATNHASVTLLQAAGYKVDIPAGQTCCGALHSHSGDLHGAARLARQNIAAFARTEGPIVTNSAGCGAMLRAYGDLLAADPVDKDRAAAAAARVCDLSQALSSADFAAGHARQRAAGAAPVTVAYQDACHLRNVQGVWREPRRLLAALPGHRLVELPEPSVCCGAAGIYNLMHPAVAAQLQARKLQAALALGAEVLVTANPGCLLHLQAGVRRLGLADRLQVTHLADYLSSCSGRRPKQINDPTGLAATQSSKTSTNSGSKQALASPRKSASAAADE